MIMLQNTAILILTCNDFEAMEITVNQVLRTTPKEVKIYLLSNCHGLPGAEVCDTMCRISSRAQHDRIRWINPKKRQPAYFGILEALQNHISEEYIVKIDDDVFPVTDGWLDALIDCYGQNDDGSLAYVSAMVNNNPYGFSQLVQLPALKEGYEKAMLFPHIAGEFVPSYQEFRVSAAGDVDPGGWGTVWQFPQLARWIHNETTMQPERYVELVKDLNDASYDASIRYSINVMLFRKDFWAEFGDGGQDDEEMVHRYCTNEQRRIVIRRKVPFVHLYFGPQKVFLTDLLPKVRDVYRPMDEIAGAELVDDWGAFKANWAAEQLKKK